MSVLPQPVLVVGTGLIGTSVALGLRRAGVEVLLADRDPEAVGVATRRGAGFALGAPAAAERPDPGVAVTVPPGSVAGAAAPAATPADRAPGMVVVAVPPAATAAVVADALRRWPEAVVTDVASVKAGIHRALAAMEGLPLGRYVGGHPMAGREVSGPAAARADLVDDRPWVVAAHPGSDEDAVAAVQELVLAVRALPVLMTPAEHDRTVALVSHVPQVLSSLLAAQLLDAPEISVSVAGQGLRDMTRIAASDADLWTQILASNSSHVAAVLSALRADLDEMVVALQHGGEEQVGTALRRGNEGRERVPGKHGAATRPTREVPVAVADVPGELGRLFAEVAEAGLSVEDVRIEHVLGRPTGVVEIAVVEDSADDLAARLRTSGWDVRA